MFFTVTVRPYKKRGKKPRGNEKWEIDMSIRFPDDLPPFRKRLVSRLSTKAKSEDWGRTEAARLYNKGRPKSRSQRKTEQAKEKPIPTLKEFAPRYIEYLAANNCTEGTQETRTKQLKHLLPLFGSTPLSDLKAESFTRLKAVLQKKPDGTERSPRTRNQIVALLYKMLLLAKEWEVLTEIPPRPKRLKEPKVEIEVYSQEEFERLVEGAKLVGWQAHLVVLLAGEAGLRCAEVLGLRWKDIDLKAGYLVVRQQQQKERAQLPKSKNFRKIELTPRLLAALKAAQHLEERVIVRPNTFTKDHNLQLWLSASERKAKLVGEPKSIHKLRHTFASRLLSRGASLKAVQVLLGHQSLQTTMMYLHLQPSEGAAAIQLLSGETAEKKR